MSSKTYNPQKIENKWRERWEENYAHKTGDDPTKPKFYCLDMFPYPSGDGLHVGHWRGYVLSDVWSRYKKLQGFNVLHPMGWDAFGLPAENDAIKKGIHPQVSTIRNIANFKRQLTEMGAIYDWDREVNTSDPEFYKFTQWIFLQMYKKGLAYRKEMPINWCPSCKTGLANEEVVDGRCERCETEITKKPLEQWMLKITQYADRLLDDLDKLDWPGKVKKMQTNWIGRSEGAEIVFPLIGTDNSIKVFTTRADTLFGVTYIVLAPEHPLVDTISTPEHKKEVDEYVAESMRKSNIERMTQGKEKTGVFTGSYAKNPVNNEPIPIWISDYVLMDYGTGAIMAVPAHDNRDYEFALAFNLPVKQVIVANSEDVKETHKLIKGVVERLEHQKVNTAISLFMSYINYLGKEHPEGLDRDSLGKFITLLAPFVPHFAEEIWEAIGNTQSIFETSQWPEYDTNIIQESTIELPIQINGRVRDTIIMDKDAPKDEVIQKAKSSEVIKSYIESNSIYKEIYIPQKVINFVVKQG